MRVAGRLAAPAYAYAVFTRIRAQPDVWSCRKNAIRTRHFDITILQKMIGTLRNFDCAVQKNIAMQQEVPYVWGADDDRVCRKMTGRNEIHQ